MHEKLWMIYGIPHSEHVSKFNAVMVKADLVTQGLQISALPVLVRPMEITAILRLIHIL